MLQIVCDLNSVSEMIKFRKTVGRGFFFVSAAVVEVTIYTNLLLLCLCQMKALILSFNSLTFGESGVVMLMVF